jgi:hypothetical protein
MLRTCSKRPDVAHERCDTLQYTCVNWKIIRLEECGSYLKDVESDHCSRIYGGIVLCSQDFCQEKRRSTSSKTGRYHVAALLGVLATCVRERDHNTMRLVDLKRLSRSLRLLLRSRYHLVWFRVSSSFAFVHISRILYISIYFSVPLG